jgi:predicted SAM-dependent methyltransferase
VKLEIGSGRHPKDGYVHLDIDISLPHLEYVCPAWEVPEKDFVFTEIYARHVLEHFTLEQAILAVREWHRLLQVTGTVCVIVPNLGFHARQLTMEGKSEFVNDTNVNHAMAGFYGWQGRGEAHYHRWGYTEQSLKSLFMKNKFDNVIICPCRECDIEAIACKTRE